MRNPNEVKALIDRVKGDFPLANFANKGMIGAAIGVINRCCGTNERRHLLFNYLFGKSSSKELSGADWIALMRWIDVVRVGNGINEQYLPQNDLQDEINMILNEIERNGIGAVADQAELPLSPAGNAENRGEDQKDYYEFD